MDGSSARRRALLAGLIAIPAALRGELVRASAACDVDIGTLPADRRVAWAGSDAPWGTSHAIPQTSTALLAAWTATPQVGATMDVAVYFHGHSSAKGADFRLERYGADTGIARITAPSASRPSPLLLLLPRGKHTGGTDGKAYDFPGITDESSGLDRLIAFGLAEVGQRARLAAAPVRGRTILIGHSGGCRAVGRALARNQDTVQEVFVLDGVYDRTRGQIADWVRRAAPAGSARALCVVYGSATRATTLPLRAVLPVGQQRLRLVETSVDHRAIPKAYGWRLLADAEAILPRDQDCAT